MRRRIHIERITKTKARFTTFARQKSFDIKELCDDGRAYLNLITFTPITKWYNRRGVTLENLDFVAEFLANEDHSSICVYAATGKQRTLVKIGVYTLTEGMGIKYHGRARVGEEFQAQEVTFEANVVEKPDIPMGDMATVQII